MQRVETCPSCSSAITGEHCANCGERRPSARIYTLREFAHEAFETVTSVERSFLRTFRALLRKPGELTAAYMRGERIRYLKPLQLFLLVNVMFFFAAGPGINVFSTSLHNHLRGSPYRAQAQRVVAERLPRSGLTEDQYAVTFNRHTRVLARTMVIAMVPAFALGLALLTIRRRRPAVHHLVFSLHFLAITMLLTATVSWLLWSGLPIWRAIGWPRTDPQLDQTAGLLMAMGCSAYLLSAFRRAYGLGRGGAALLAIVGFALLVAILVGYRMLLFHVTAYTL